jgi:hypothetical protein
MKNQNSNLEKVWSGMGWGLLFIVVGLLFIAGNLGWMPGEMGWSYFAIGLGGIIVIGFLVRYFGVHTTFLNGLVSLVIGLALIFVGLSSLYGFDAWWPLALIIVGAGYLVKSIWENRAGAGPKTTTRPTC